MKVNKKIVLTLAVGLVFAFSSIASSNGGYPLGESPYDKTTAPLIKANFTIMKYKKPSDEIKYGCRVTAILNYTQTQDIKSFYCELDDKISNNPLCNYTEKKLLLEFFDKCDEYKTIPALFGLQGKPFIITINFDELRACGKITEKNPSIITGTCKIRIE